MHSRRGTFIELILSLVRIFPTEKTQARPTTKAKFKCQDWIRLESDRKGTFKNVNRAVACLWMETYLHNIFIPTRISNISHEWWLKRCSMHCVSFVNCTLSTRQTQGYTSASQETYIERRARMNEKSLLVSILTIIPVSLPLHRKRFSYCPQDNPIALRKDLDFSLVFSHRLLDIRLKRTHIEDIENQARKEIAKPQWQCVRTCLCVFCCQDLQSTLLYYC